MSEGSPGQIVDNLDEEDEELLLATSSRVVVLPDKRICDLVLEQDDRRSTGCSTPEGLDDLEYEYEPGISLRHLEFASSHQENPGQESQKCVLCGVDYESDLQLAAELGKTLLERNKELEGTLKQQQAIIEDQSQEIEYLTKQTAALREVNDSRVKIYEQLEVSISELENANKKLIDDNLADKGRIKSLCSNIVRLETRVEDLQKCVEDAKCAAERQQVAKRRRERRKSSQQRREPESPETTWADHESEDGMEERVPTPSTESSSSSSSANGGYYRHQESGYSSSSVESHLHRLAADSDSEPSSSSSSSAANQNETILEEENDVERDRDDEAVQVTQMKVHKSEADQKLDELEKHVETLDKENKRLRLETQMIRDSSSLTDSLISVDEEVQEVAAVRAGKLCRKCLGVVDATPATLISTAVCLMGDTLKVELQKSYLASSSSSSSFGLRSRSAWLDLWLLTVCAVAFAILLTSSIFRLANDLTNYCT